MSQNLENFAKFQKFQLDNLVEFEKCCQTRIQLQNFVLIQPKTSNILPKFCQKPTAAARRGAPAGGAVDRSDDFPRHLAAFGKISAKCCSFSAVSEPIFASKYAFCSIFQNLPDYLAEIFEI